MSRNQDRKKAIPRVGDGSQIITIHLSAEGDVMAMHALLAKRLSDPDAWRGNGGPAAAAAAAGGNGLSDYALEELNRALTTQLMAARSCLNRLGDMAPVGPSMQRELQGVLVNGVLDARQYLEADGPR